MARATWIFQRVEWPRHKSKWNVNSCVPSAPEACESFGICRQNSFQKNFIVVEGTFSLFRTCAMAMSKRLTVDPCLGVSDIMAPFLQFFKEQGKYDMRALIEPKVQATWKTAPDPEWLASLHPLWMKVLRVAPACILPSKKLKDALEKIQREITRLNFSRVSDEVYFDSMDQLIRISASQLRTLKKDSAQYQRTMKKASISEKEKVDELLSCIKVPQSDINDATIPTVDSAMVASGSGNASGSGHASGSGNASGSGIGSGNASGSGNVAIFQQILQGLPTERRPLQAQWFLLQRQILPRCQRLLAG